MKSDLHRSRLRRYSLLLALACFLKFSIVLSLLGRALGGRALPAFVVGAVALLLAMFVLAPTAEKVLGEGNGALLRGDAVELAAHGTEPVRSFLEHHTPPDAQRELAGLQRGLRPPAEQGTVRDRDLVVLMPAFALSELKAAFRIGFFLLLPFLLLDLLVGVVLLALGVHTLEARVVSLPLKLLLFVAVDGWSLLVHGLLTDYSA